jgi:hypothetical protein
MKLVVHPAADIFPMMSEDETKELKRSITAHGLREKIGVIQNPDNVNELLIVDGRNRWHALVGLGVDTEVIIREFTKNLGTQLVDLGASPEEYILMANIERRNLSQKQRRDLAGKLAVMYAEQQKEKPKEEQEDSLQKTADIVGVSRRTVATAKKQHMARAGTPTLVKKPEKKAEQHIAARTVITRLEADITATKKFGAKWPVESLQNIVEFCDTMQKECRIHLLHLAEEAQQKAEDAMQKIADAEAASDGDEAA